MFGGESAVEAIIDGVCEASLLLAPLRAKLFSMLDVEGVKSDDALAVIDHVYEIIQEVIAVQESAQQRLKTAIHQLHDLRKDISA
jgi:hypothetical protein